MNAVFAALDRRLDPASPSPLVVALSGGGDSMALLLLTLHWASAHRRPVLALTVDHGLNPESACWTAEAGAAAVRHGAAWQGLRWEGPKPTTGLPAKARAARHALLARAARAAGAPVILMGHTADDVAEGNLMRAGDAPGLGRVREWAPSPVWPEGRGVFVLRPLLGVVRSALRALLVERGQSWIDDPANEDPHYARVRARRRLTSDFISEGQIPAVEKVSPVLGAPLANRVEFDEGAAILPRQWLADSPNLKPTLSALLLSVSGGSRPPRGAELDRLIAAIGAGRTTTLCGCRVAVSGDQIIVARAPARRGFAPAPLEPPHWIAERFAAACGLYPDEASIPPPS